MDGLLGGAVACWTFAPLSLIAAPDLRESVLGGGVGAEVFFGVAPGIGARAFSGACAVCAGCARDGSMVFTNVSKWGGERRACDCMKANHTPDPAKNVIIHAAIQTGRGTRRRKK